MQLVANYGAAVAQYYAAVSKLEEGMITGSNQVYDERYKAAEQVRSLCEAARKALVEHVEKHGC